MKSASSVSFSKLSSKPRSVFAGQWLDRESDALVRGNCLYEPGTSPFASLQRRFPLFFLFPRVLRRAKPSGPLIGPRAAHGEKINKRAVIIFLLSLSLSFSNLIFLYRCPSGELFEQKLGRSWLAKRVCTVYILLYNLQGA